MKRRDNYRLIPEARAGYCRRSEPRFITIPPERGALSCYTEEQLTVMCGELTAEQHRRKTIRYKAPVS
jgi:hypothetical protein